MEWLYWEMPGRHPNQCLIYPQLALFNANGQNCFTEPFKYVLTTTFFLIANFSHMFFLGFLSHLFHFYVIFIYFMDLKCLCIQSIFRQQFPPFFLSTIVLFTGV